MREVGGGVIKRYDFYDGGAVATAWRRCLNPSSARGVERSETIRNSLRAKARMDVTAAARERGDDGTDDASFIRSFPIIARS